MSTVALLMAFVYMMQENQTAVTHSRFQVSIRWQLQGSSSSLTLNIPSNYNNYLRDNIVLLRAHTLACVRPPTVAMHMSLPLLLYKPHPFLDKLTTVDMPHASGISHYIYLFYTSRLSV